MTRELPLHRRSFYWLQIRRWAKRHSDGCTGVADCYVDACFEHDYHYRHGATFYGEPITRAQADLRLRLVIQNRSPLGAWDPVSWFRWAGVRLLGGYAWKGTR